MLGGDPCGRPRPGSRASIGRFYGRRPGNGGYAGDHKGPLPTQHHPRPYGTEGTFAKTYPGIFLKHSPERNQP